MSAVVVHRGYRRARRKNSDILGDEELRYHSDIKADALAIKCRVVLLNNGEKSIMRLKQ